jgi:DNA-binding NarL/FixJ family response regulator
MDSIDGPRVVAVETNVEDAIGAVRDLQPSILMVDKAFGLPIVMDCVRLFSTAPTPTAVVVWGSPMTESESLRFLQAGAAGVIRKTASLKELSDCIRAVAAGRTWMDSDVVRGPSPAPRTVRSALTPREVQVMDLVERGLKNKDIGVTLGIRTGTVKIHLKHIFEKTGIRGRYGLALSGLKNKGLLTVVV